MIMQFFQSFSALGYSAINVLLFWLVLLVVGYRVLGLQARHWVLKILYLVVLVSILVATTNFLASENRRLNDSIRDEGGLKRTKTR